MGAKEDILTAAVQLFATYGFHKTTMDMIAREANVAKGTLYWHFGSKQDLFLGIIERDTERYYSQLEKIKDDTVLTSQEKVEAVIDQKFDFFHKYQTLVREVMSSPREITSDFACRMEEIRIKHLNLLTEIFAEGKARGDFVIEDPRVVASAFMGISIGISSQNDLLAEIEEEKISRMVKHLVLFGVLSS